LDSPFTKSNTDLPGRPTTAGSGREATSPSRGSGGPWGLLIIPLAILFLIWAGADALAQESGAGGAQDQQAAEDVGAEEQQAAEDARAPDQPVTYGEIVVTAQKRSETLLEVPLSVTAFTDDFIQEYNLTNLVDIAARTPGLYYGNYPDEKLSPTTLRGVYATAGSAGADPAISRYVDEVYVGQGAGAFIDLFDTERVEVLRGPQGLYFGRNSIGGAISYTTKKPSNEFEALIEGTYGDYNQHRVGALISGPLVTDRLAAKVSAISNGRDGTYTNLWLNREGNEIGNWSARGQLLWTPGSATQVTLTAEHSEIDQESLLFETLKYDDANGLLPLALGLFGLPRNEDPWDRKGYSDIEQPETLDLDGYSVNLTTAIGDVELTSITSYREHQYDSIRSTDASPLRWAYDGDPEQVDRLAQEIRVAWSTTKTSFVLGVYYFDQTAANQSFIHLGEDLMALLIGVPLFVEAGSDAVTDTTSYAGFANLTFTLSDRADMSIGVRYTRDEKEINYSQEDALGLLGGTFTLQAGDSWNAATPAFNLRYRFTDDVRGYVNVGRGFKSGGFNDGLGSADGIAFGPEFLWNYEVGVKSRLAQGRVTANFAAYYTDWTDIQITNDNPNTPIYDPIILNAGAAHSTGLEGEVVAYPSRNWVLGANFSVMDAKHDGGTLPDGTPLDKPVKSPDYTANLNAEYRDRLTGSLEWFVGAEMLNTGEHFLDPTNQEDGRVDPYTVYNARLGLGPEDRGWSVMVWGRNLTDETVKERLFDLYDQPLIAQKYIVLNDPVTYGVTVRFAF
jgi:iron complex outermembrane receptor protein